MTAPQLSERESRILEAVVRIYVETAEPAGSRTVTRRFRLGISAATVRNTMSDLEEKGLLFHPHTSAGRVPTDLGYRVFVNSLLERPVQGWSLVRAIRAQLAEGEVPAVEDLIGRAARLLGLLTKELGVALAPRLEDAVLERIELIPLSSRKVLVVLVLVPGSARAVYLDVPVEVPPDTLGQVAGILNERLAGVALRELRESLPVRLRDSVPADDRLALDVVEVLTGSADAWIPADEAGAAGIHLGRASILAEQPEFSTGERMRALLELLERQDLLRDVLAPGRSAEGIQITIGSEHDDPVLADLAVVTSTYRIGGKEGVIGVIGPTRMAYDRVIGMVEGTSRLVSEMGSNVLDRR